MRTESSASMMPTRNINFSLLITVILIAAVIILGACSAGASAERRTDGIPLGGTSQSSAAEATSGKDATKAGAGSATSGSSALPVPVDRAQLNKGGNVTIQVTWKGPQGSSDELLLEVGMDTHSEDLDDIDLSKSAMLRNDKGVELAPISQDIPLGGHHRKGTLTFPMVANDKPLIEKDTKYVELVIRDVSGISERVIRWDMKVKA